MVKIFLAQEFFFFIGIDILRGVKIIPVAKSDAVQTVALNVPRYAATLALYILITQACSDFYNFSSLSYYGNINSNKSVRYKLNETSEKTRGR